MYILGRLIVKGISLNPISFTIKYILTCLLIYVYDFDVLELIHCDLSRMTYSCRNIQFVELSFKITDIDFYPVS